MHVQSIFLIVKLFQSKQYSGNIFTFCGNAKTIRLCSCGFANIPGSGNLLINYDGGETYDFTPFGNDFISLGNTPPRKEFIIEGE